MATSLALQPQYPKKEKGSTFLHFLLIIPYCVSSVLRNKKLQWRFHQLGDLL